MRQPGQAEGIPGSRPNFKGAIRTDAPIARMVWTS